MGLEMDPWPRRKGQVFGKTQSLGSLKTSWRKAGKKGRRVPAALGLPQLLRARHCRLTLPSLGICLQNPKSLPSNVSQRLPPSL